MVSRGSGGTRGRLLSAGAVVVGLAAVYGITTVTGPAAIGSSIQLGHESRAPVSSAIRACPAPGSAGVTAGSVATTALPGRSAGGSAAISRLTGTGTTTTGAPVRTLTTPGVLTLSPVSTAAAPLANAPRVGANTGAAGGTRASGGTASPAPSGSPAPGPAVATTPGRGGVVVQATGAMAQGLEVEQVGFDGLTTAQCSAPGTDFWFVGPGVAGASHVELYLMNTDGQPGDVEVDALTDSGPLLGSSDTGIIVPPHSMVVQSLGTYLHGSHALSLHVTTSTGRVAAAVRQASNITTTGAFGVSAPAEAPGGWLPATQPPSTRLTIPGLPGTTGTVTLYLAVPGSSNAQVKVTAVTAKGTYQPTGGSGIDLPGDSAVATQIASLSGVPAAIRITSNVPVTAAAVISGGAAGAPGAVSAAAAPVTEQGVAAANPAGPKGATQLVISAPGKAVTVRITTATAKVSLAGQAGTTVTVPAGHTVVTSVEPPKGGGPGPFSVVVTPQPGSGPAYIGRVIRSGGIVRSIMPLTSALTSVPLPPAQDSLNAIGSPH
ncbi:MAG TPA: DUF5719 family protein [Streptosporangiaceae bacterium]|nr:DUF5719 family protein [Streptosporangiaceae bacterium]